MFDTLSTAWPIDWTGMARPPTAGRAGPRPTGRSYRGQLSEDLVLGQLGDAVVVVAQQVGQHLPDVLPVGGPGRGHPARCPAQLVAGALHEDRSQQRVLDA